MGEKGKGRTAVLPPCGTEGEQEMRTVCVRRGYADAKVRWTLHSKSFCLQTSNSAEIWMQNKNASVSSVTIFHPIKVITWFSKLWTKTHRLCAASMWSDPVTWWAQRSFWLLNRLISGFTSYDKFIDINKTHKTFKALNKSIWNDL